MPKQVANVVALLIVLVLVVAAVGCGGGGDTTDGGAATESASSGSTGGGSPADGDGPAEITTSSLTKAEFIKRADAICRKSDEAKFEAVARAEEGIKEEEAETESKVSLAETEAAFADEVLPVFRKQAEEIRALGAPSGDEGEVEAIVDGMEEAVDVTEEDLSKAESAFAKVDKLSAAYGFKDCAEAE